MTTTPTDANPELIYQIANYLYARGIGNTATHAEAIIGMVAAAMPAAEPDDLADNLNLHGVAIGELAERVKRLEAFTGVATMNDLEGSHRVHMDRDHAPLAELASRLTLTEDRIESVSISSRIGETRHNATLAKLRKEYAGLQTLHSALAKALLSPPAVPGAEPTTDADGLVRKPLSQGELNYLHEERLDAQDAALVELRERFDFITTDVNRTMLDVSTLGKRHNNLVAKVQQPTPPAVPERDDQ